VAAPNHSPAGPQHDDQQYEIGFWRIVSPPDAKWKAPYSARFHFGASAPGG
jgi:hypothetical protein